jgi:hypothetical protein
MSPGPVGREEKRVEAGFSGGYAPPIKLVGLLNP